MQYNIEMDGNEFALSPYTVAISEEIEAIEAKNNGEGKFREKLKTMYDFVTKIADGAAEYLGDFSSCDPNTINLMYMRIIKSYNAPVEEYEREQTKEQLGNENMDKVMEMLSLMSKIDSKKTNKK